MKKKFENFGEEARQIRLAKGLTQLQLAKLIGSHSQTVSNVERGLAAYPKPETDAMYTKLKLSKTEMRNLFYAVMKDELANKSEHWSKRLRLK